MLWWKDMATERPINNEAHRARAAAPRERICRRRKKKREKWLTREPAEHHRIEGVFRSRGESEVWGWNLKFQNQCNEEKKTERETTEEEKKWNTTSSALLCIITYQNRRVNQQLYLKENKKRKRRWELVYLCIQFAFKTWLCLIHQTQVAQRS